MDKLLPIYSKNPTQADLALVHSRLTKDKLDDIRSKVDSITRCIIFESYENRLLAERMVEYGLLLAHVDISNDQPCEQFKDEFCDVMVECYAHSTFDPFYPKDIDRVIIRLAKPLKSRPYHEALARQLKDSYVGDMLIRSAVVLDLTVPEGEVHFSLDGEKIYRLKGVKQ